jgi:hypothetical protein
MSIYKHYRTIYEEHYGPIPKDETGRTFDIHHLDGNKHNNDPSNLIALSIQDHYNIHYSQHDYGACFLIAKRMSKSKELISDLNTKQNIQRVKNGTHLFLNSDFQREMAKRPRKRSPSVYVSESNKKRMLKGEHIQVSTVTCPYCNKKGNYMIMKRWHFHNCKNKTS